MKALYKKELRTYFYSMTAPAVIVFILLFGGFFVSLNSLFSLASSIETSYSNTLFVLLVAIPVLSMKGFASEKSSGTQKLVDSLPISSLSYLLSKFFAMLTVVAIPLLVLFLYTFVLGIYGKVNILSSLGATIAFILCSAAMLAVSLFISSLTESVAVCASATFTCLLAVYFLPTAVLMLPDTAISSFLILTVLAALLGLLCGYISRSKLLCSAIWLTLESLLLCLLCFFSETLEGAAERIVSSLSLTERFSSFTLYGIFDISSIVYYITVSALFLAFTYFSLEKRRRG